MPEPDEAAKKEPAEAKFPRKDEHGRVLYLTDLLAYFAMMLVIGALMWAAIDGVFALVGGDAFGQTSGWISGVLVVFAFFSEFSAYKDVRARWAVALGALLLALLLGIAVLVVLPAGWWPLLSGIASVSASALAFGVLWFAGIRLFGAGK